MGKELERISHKYGHICVGFFLTPSPTSVPTSVFPFFPILIVEGNVHNNLGLFRVDLLGSLQLVRVYSSFRSLSTSRGRCFQCLRQRASWLRRGPSTYWPTLGHGSWTGGPRELYGRPHWGGVGRGTSQLYCPFGKGPGHHLIGDLYIKSVRTKLNR